MHDELETRRSRLSEEAIESPWVAAENLTDCFLYWMPVGAFPLRSRERTWITEFHRRFFTSISKAHGLRTELFVQYKSLQDDLQAAFLRYAQKSIVLMGLGRKPSAVIPALPTAADLQRIVAEREAFDLRRWVADYMMWLVQKEPDRQRELFLGYGGLTSISLAPDPKTKAPRLPFNQALRDSHPAFQHFDVDAHYSASFALGDAFLKRSKDLFGEGLEQDPQYRGITFILPLLESGHFFAATPIERAQWFSLFDIYWNESVVDKGIVLSFQKDYREVLHSTLESLTADGYAYALFS